MVRVKVRYILFEILYPELASDKPRNESRTVNDGKILLNAVRSSIETHFGEYGSGKCQSTLALRHFNPRTSSGILKVGRECTPIVQAALTYIRKIKDQPVIIRVTHISGTVKKCEESAINIRRKELCSL